jgi:phosphotransacetylase
VARLVSIMMCGYAITGADLTSVPLDTAETQTNYTVLSDVFFLCTELRFKMLGEMNAAFTMLIV